jgi:hypothetical protein
MAMEGVPWTKAWGAMFLVSFLVGEALVVVSWIYMPCKPYQPLPGSPDADRLLRFRTGLETVDGHSLACSGSCHILVLAWVVVDIHGTFSPPLFDGFPGEDGQRLPLPIETFTILWYMAWALASFPCLLCLVLCIIWPRPIVPVGDPEGDGIMSELAFRFQLTVGLACAVFLGAASGFGLWAVTVWGLFLVLGLPGLIIYLYLENFAEQFPMISRSVFITWESSTKKRERKREKRGASDGYPDLTFACFAMFLYSTILCLVWYCHRYNPDGTMNRGWTGVFG